MAEKYFKIIQNGTISYVPNNQANKNFWAKQNSLVSRSHAAHKETVTILEATDEEVAFMQHSDVGSSKPTPRHAQNIDTNTILEMMNRLQKQNDEQAQKINDLLAKQNEQITESPTGPNDESDTILKEKGKPGPKPKEK